MKDTDNTEFTQKTFFPDQIALFYVYKDRVQGIHWSALLIRSQRYLMIRRKAPRRNQRTILSPQK